MITGMGYHKAEVNQYTQMVKLLHVPSRMGCFGQKLHLKPVRASKLSSEHFSSETKQQTFVCLALAKGMSSLLGQPWSSGLATTMSSLPKAAQP